jgi:hypothetical protein
MRHLLLLSACLCVGLFIDVTTAYGTQLEGSARCDDAILPDTTENAMPPVAPPRSPLLNGQTQSSVYAAQTQYNSATLDSLQTSTSPMSGTIARPLLRSRVSGSGNPAFDRIEFGVRLPSEEHGQELFGVLGTRYNAANCDVLEVYQQSHAFAYGIEAGDRILEIDGQPCNGLNIQRLCRGVPETIVNLVILRRGEVLRFSVPRTDSRLLSSEGGYYASQAQRTRFW